MRLLTNSAARCYRSCPRKYYIQYVEGFRPLETPGPLFFGTACHVGLAQLWQGQSVDLSTTGLESFDLVRAEEMLRGYSARWGKPENVQAVEVEFHAPLVNPATKLASRTWELAGKLDAVQSSLLVEHKTSGSNISPGSDYWRQLRLDQQISTYFLGAESLGYDCTACMYDVLGKPKLRPCRASKKRAHDETPDEYRGRVRADIAANPDRYYQRGTVVRLADEAAEAAHDLWQTAKLIRESELYKRWPRNPDACFHWGRACAFFPACTSEASLDDPYLYRKTETVHEELTQEASAV